MTTKKKQMAAPKNRPSKPPRKIAIIGKAPSSALLGPYDDQTWEIWILNTLGSANEVPRWDRQFELHDLKLTQTDAHGNYYKWLTEQTKPVYVRDDPPPEYPHFVKYPLGQIQETFKPLAGREYLTNSVSMQVALALYEHATQWNGQVVSDIGLWGVDMAQHGLTGAGPNGWFTSEYARQRPSVEYWLGLAEGLGIKITIPPQSDILKTACIYGYQSSERFLKFQARRKELQQRIGGAQAQEQRSHDEALFLAGALEGMNYDEQWLGGGGQ